MRVTDPQLTELEQWAARISETDGAWDPDTDGIVSPRAQCAAIKALVDEVRKRRAADLTAEKARQVVRDAVTSRIACVAGWSGFEPGSLKRMTDDIANDVAFRLGLDT